MTLDENNSKSIIKTKKIISLVSESLDVQNLFKFSLQNEKDYELYIFGSLAALRREIEEKEIFIDVLLLDEYLPDGRAKDFCNELKKKETFKQLPIIILTEERHIGDKWLSSHSGAADDFILKPFEGAELRSRIESHLCIHDVYASSKKLRHNDETMDLSPLQFKILDYLAHHEGEIHERNKLIEAIWGLNSQVTDRTIDQHISKIKKKISKTKHTIKSIYGVGYMFTEKNQ